MSTPIDNGVSGADWRKTLDELRDLGESLRSVMDKKERLAKIEKEKRLINEQDVYVVDEARSELFCTWRWVDPSTGDAYQWTTSHALIGKDPREQDATP